MLEVVALEAYYDRLQVLFGVDLHCADREIVAILGANGSGKSTLLKAISGLLIPARGSVRFAGQDITRLPAQDRVRRGLAMVMGGARVLGPMSVEDNLHLGAYLFRGDRRRVAASFERVYTAFPRLLERRTQIAGSLSGGEQQMVAVGRALMSEPKMILLDEPSLGLAPKMVDEVYEMLARLRAAEQTILLVEQNVTAALSIADRAYIIQTGRVALEGATAELKSDQRVAELYLGGVTAV